MHAQDVRASRAHIVGDRSLRALCFLPCRQCRALLPQTRQLTMPTRPSRGGRRRLAARYFVWRCVRVRVCVQASRPTNDIQKTPKYVPWITRTFLGRATKSQAPASRECRITKLLVWYATMWNQPATEKRWWCRPSTRTAPMLLFSGYSGPNSTSARERWIQAMYRCL